MEKEQLLSLVSELTERNKKLLRHVVNLLLDEVVFSSKNHVTLTIDGIVELKKFARALKYLKNNKIVKDYSFLHDFEESILQPQPINWITVFFNTELLRTFAKLLDNSEKPHAITGGYVGAIGYDDEHAVITFNGKSAKLFTPEILEAFLFGKVHKADGARLNSIHLVEQYEDKSRNNDIYINNKALTNAKDRINKKFAAEFGADNIVMYERSQFWLNHSYISENSPYITG